MVGAQNLLRIFRNDLCAAWLVNPFAISPQPARTPSLKSILRKVLRYILDDFGDVRSFRLHDAWRQREILPAHPLSHSTTHRKLQRAPTRPQFRPIQLPPVSRSPAVEPLSAFQSDWQEVALRRSQCEQSARQRRSQRRLLAGKEKDRIRCFPYSCARLCMNRRVPKISVYGVGVRGVRGSLYLSLLVKYRLNRHNHGHPGQIGQQNQERGEFR